MKLIVQHFQKIKWSTLNLESDLESRGLLNAEISIYIQEFSYREDALSYSNAISTYVKDLLSLFYDSDEAVKNDSEVQNWIKDVVENGFREMPNFGLPSELKTRKDLFEVCSRLICQVSIGHATYGFLVEWSKLLTISLNLSKKIQK